MVVPTEGGFGEAKRVRTGDTGSSEGGTGQKRLRMVEKLLAQIVGVSRLMLDERTTFILGSLKGDK